MVATASTGVAKAKFDIDTEDTITLTCQWQNLEDGSLATGARRRVALALFSQRCCVFGLFWLLLLLDSCSAAFGSLLTRLRHLKPPFGFDCWLSAAYAWLSTAC